MSDEELELTEDEATEFIIECEEIIEGIKNGEIPGEYLEF